MPTIHATAIMKKPESKSSSGAVYALLAVTAAIAVLGPAGLRAIGVNGTKLDVSSNWNTFNGGGGNAAVGDYNYVGYYSGPATNSMAVGSNNWIDGYPNPTDSFTAGTSNGVMGSSSVALGYVNQVDGTANIALGSHLATSYNWDSTVVVGQYNDVNEYAGTQAFTVGNGTGVSGSDYRRNAFIVLKNGDVIIPNPQGDIPMYSGSQ